MDALRSAGDGVRLSVHVQPRAKTTAWSGPHGDVMRVRVAAQPIGGKANKALIAFVAETFGVGKDAVTIVRGEKNRRRVPDWTAHMLLQSMGSVTSLEPT